MVWTPQKRWAQGKKAKHKGKEFEQIIERACHRSGIAIKRTDPPMRTDGKGKIWRERSGVDAIIGYQGIAVILDFKSTDSDRIQHSVLKPHQLSELSQWQTQGFTAGYLCWFREIDVLGFVPISDLLKLSPGQSIKADQTFILGNSLDFELGRLFSIQWESLSCPKCRNMTP